MATFDLLSDTPRTIVLVGGGLASVSAAEALRLNGFEGRIFLVSGEPIAPYDRPPLSKAFLSGAADQGSLSLRGPEFFKDQHIDFVTSLATSVDLTQRRLYLEKGSLSFDRLLIATGSRPRRLLAPHPEGALHYLQTLGDAQRLKEQLRAGAKVAVVGGGFIGLEVASTATQLGCEVELILQGSRLLKRSVIPEISDHLRALHGSQGVNIRLRSTIRRIKRDANAFRLELSDESMVDADVVVVGIGSEPNVALADAMGLSSGDGIWVDESMRSSMAAVFAAGDVANHWNDVHGCRLRLESWQNAQRQGIVAAKSMLGLDTKYCEAPWFWTDQFDTNLQMLGLAPSYDRIMIRGRPQDNCFSILLLLDGRLVGALFVNDGRNVRPVREAIDRKIAVDAQRLYDPDISLRTLLAKSSAESTVV